MLLGQRCTVVIDGVTKIVTFLGYDAGDARVQEVGTNGVMVVSVISLKAVR